MADVTTTALPNDDVLRLDISPEAIRQHFHDSNDADSRWVEAVDDATLRSVCFDVLTSETLYQAFHRAITDAIERARVTAATPAPEEPDHG